ncbi:CHASE2 domain-containing protein [Curvibacter sp. HBC28]|uniref:CHASE2 domain-containing protein n=1 Tax=Curvibacter microcysteis TaxID=3026419 RepID=A0ABT5MGY8_9BURK|nr:CHASE2 domain-containing protein [Curvibacter sp. HBC28]MDD0815818.1 CHASE2 domain-containing protein [Curvibacter sp. HBC28]
MVDVLWRRARAWLRPLGGLSSTVVMVAAGLLFALWVGVDAFLLHQSSGLSKSSYDWMVRHRWVAAEPDPRIVIIDIDEASLARLSAEFGRWPWPRDVLATVLNHVEQQQPAAVVWDVLFADPDPLSPGGDTAFNAAVERSPHSHFSVLRLPPSNDSASQIRAPALPGLWVDSQSVGSSTVALIPPVLPAVAAAPLGLTNAEPEADGVLRRFEPLQRLPDGSWMHTLPVSVQRTLQPQAYQRQVAAARAAGAPASTLIAWRRSAQAYPHVPMADVLAVAEGQSPLKPVPHFGGKVVLIGASAPTLHDSHATPLASAHAGVDILATLIDNELHERHPMEIPEIAQIALALGLCLLIALTMHWRGLSVLDGLMLDLPLLLLAVSYLSLQTDWVFLDLHLAAAWSLAFVALLRLWAGIRQDHWCQLPPPGTPGLSLLPMQLPGAWDDHSKNRLMSVLERHAPTCRLLLATPGAHVQGGELAGLASLIGPTRELAALQAPCQTDRWLRGLRLGPVQALDPRPDGVGWVPDNLAAWQQLLTTRSTPKEFP